MGKSSDEKKNGESIVDKILGLFLGAGGPEADKKRYLKQITKDLSKSRFKFLKPASDEILPAFAKFVYELYKAVYPAQAMFAGIQNPNILKKLAINSVMDEKTLEISETLSETAITELSKTMNVDELKEKIQTGLDVFLNVFTAETCAFVDELCTKILRFSDFCCFDFYQLLKKFDHNMREGDFSYVTKFTALNGEYALESIKDFMEIAWPILELSDWQPMFTALKHVRDTDAISPNAWTKIISRVRSLKDSDILEMMIQLITKNPYYKFESSSKKEHIADTYIEETKNETNRTIQKIASEQKTNKIDNLAAKVFGKTIEESLKNYTVSSSQPFERKKLGKYEFCQPLNYLKIFLLEHVKTSIKEFSDIVLIRGKWVNHTLAVPMSDSLHVLIDLSTKVADFDAALDDANVTGNKLRTLIPRSDHDRGAASIVKGIVRETNGQAKNFVVTGTRELVNIAKYIKLLLEDHDKQRAELILNWNDLKLSLQPSLKQFGTDVYKTIYLFIQLMQMIFTEA